MEINGVEQVDIFSYWTTYIIIGIVIFIFAIKPYFKDSHVRWAYREDVQIANTFWVVSIISFLYYIGF